MQFKKFVVFNLNVKATKQLFNPFNIMYENQGNSDN